MENDVNNNDLKSTIRQILLETFNPEDSSLLDTATDQITQAVRQEDLMDKALSSLTKDGKPVCAMQCNSCGYIESFQPTDVTPEDFEKDSKAVILKGKEHFEKTGWQTGWGYDLCPDCAKVRA